MCLFVIKVCVLTIFLQINGEYQDHNKNVQNDAPREVNGTETYKQCVFKEIVSKIEELLRRQINASEFRIKAAIAPPRDFFKPHENNRKIRQVDWNKCISKMDFEEHKDIETGHIEAVKKELEKLRQLVRLLRDQQLVLNLLSDANRPIPKTEDENEQKQLLELLRLLRNNMPAQSKIANNGVPLHPSKQSEGLEKVLEEITKLQNQIQSHSGSNDRTLTTELMIQKKQIATLETEVENLKNGQAIFINVSPNKTSSDVVGARLHPLFAKTPHNFSIDVKKHHGKLDHAANPKVRAGNDEFFDNLLKVLDDSEPAPEIKENQINLNTDRNLNLENRLIDLEKQLKISQKMQQLEKKIKEIHESDAESKSLGDDDEDLKVQVKKLQRQLKNLNKAKVQSKDLEGDDILDELKSLQNAIKDLRPKEDAGQSKIGGAELQIMLNKLIGVPVKPVAVQAHTQLTPTQVQVIKRIMALKAGNHESHSHAPAPQPMFELNGPHGFSYGHYPPIPYNDFYGRVYDQGAYDYHKQYYGYPTSTTPNQYGYSSYNKGDYVPKNKYGPFAQYVFGAAPYVPYKPTSYGYDAKTYVPNSGGTSYEARPPSTIHYPNSKAQTYPANVHIAPPNNGYAQQNQQFFRGYKEGESENYQTDRPELYTNTQENSYAQQKVGDLQAQIYKLQHVIGNLNNPNYVQKPEDQQTIYELDHKIGDLKGIISHMSEDDDYNSAGHGDGDAYYSRHKREITNASVQTNTTILREFFEELSDVISAINYLSENLYDVYGNYSGTTNGTTSGTRRVRETTEAEGGVHQLFHQLSNLMEYVEDLTEKATKYNQTCNNGKNCINAENHRISKRETEDSLDAVTSILGSVLDEDDDDDENTENDRQMQLQKQLDNLKQQ
ncbi:hypothetical protein FQA39_LY03023 [Lamprigera yunnana]|nr:hypothetical protein FQA39_LY03023 [Lamprigera yunnana]